MSKPVTVEHTTSHGTTIRLKLKPLEGGHVEIVEWRRRKRGASLFFRTLEEEGRVVAFEQLGLKASWAEVFGP